MAEPAPKKIALLLPSLKFGGAERVALNLAGALKGLGVQVDILLMSNEGEFLPEAKTHYNVIDLQCDKTCKLPVKLLNYLVRQRPDVLLSSFWKLNLCSCLARMLFPFFRLLLWEHSPPSKSRNSPKWLYATSASIAYQLASKVIAVSTGVRADIASCTFGLRRKLVVIFNPITPPSAELLLQHKRGDINQVIWVGRLDEPKNPGLLLEAFALLPSGCKATLVIVGDGRLRPELEQRCKALGVQERVTFQGFQANPYELMAVSDLLVMSSDREGLGNVLIEAMYCGLRVVSTDCGAGVHDILLGDRYGTIVPPKDKYAMVMAIEAELKTQHSPQDQMSGAQRFLPGMIVQQFLAAAR
ncbi:MAG: glycosyltransferase [Gammaproteobacteria bacterium]